MKYKVLIIDDSISILNTLKSFIQKDNNIDVFTAKSLKSAKEIFISEGNKFDVILADLGLPDAPNGEVVEYLSNYSIPIVI